MMANGTVSEIFSSLQGEGIYAGERQIFVRLAGCPWRCRYCDTPASLTAQGHRTLSVEEVLDQVHHLQELKEHKSASITGGEPLMQPEFLGSLLPALRRLGLRTHLETSATHPDLLRRVVDECDVVAADIKLPSSIGREFWAEHEDFLKVAGGKAFVKLVLTSESTDAEVEKAFILLASLDPAPPLVLQPVTAIHPLDQRLAGTVNGGPRVEPPAAHRLAAWWDEARHRLPNVRICPQLHPIWGLP